MANIQTSKTEVGNCSKVEASPLIGYVKLMNYSLNCVTGTLFFLQILIGLMQDKYFAGAPRARNSRGPRCTRWGLPGTTQDCHRVLKD